MKYCKNLWESTSKLSFLFKPLMIPAVLTGIFLQLIQCSSLQKSEIEFQSPNVRIERFPATFNMKGKGPVKCQSSTCTKEETGDKFKSLLRNGVWEEYVEKTNPDDPKKKYSVLSKKGEYKEGRRVGKWEEYLEKIDTKTNQTYVVLDKAGEYSDGEREGIWEYYYDDGAGKKGAVLKKSNFRKGKKEGQETKFSRAGELIEESYYVDDLLDGKYMKKTQEGLMEQEGQYSKDKKTGLWKEYYAQKKDMVLKVSTNYLDDKKHGPETRYWPDGKTRMLEGTYENGLERGPWKYFYDNGNIESEGAYAPVEAPPEPEVKEEEAKPAAVVTYDPRAQVAKPRAKRVGPWKRYYKTGAIFFEGERDGKPVGEWKYYYKNGTLAAKGQMTNDFMMNFGEIYDKSGNLEGRGKIQISIFKLNEKTDDIQLKYTPGAPFTFYKAGVKYLEITAETMPGGNKAYMYNGDSKIGEGPIDPATRKKNGCWKINGEKTYFILDQPKTGAIASMNKCI